MMPAEADELRARLTPELMADIMRANWHSHDARWFLKASVECGFDVANRLNKATIRSMARTEMMRLLEAMQCGEVRDMEDFARIANIACEVYFPAGMFEGGTEALGKDAARGIVRSCFVFEEVRRAGVTGVYECACGCRHEGWLAACGLDGKVEIVRSMMRGDPYCEVLASSVGRKAGGASL